MAKVGTAWVEIDGDLSPLNRKLNELRARGATVDVKADVDRTSFARATAAKKDAGGTAEVKVKADVDQTSFARARAAVQEITGGGGKTGIGGSLGSMAAPFGALKTGGLAALPVMQDLSGALVAVAGSAMQAAAGVGALAVGGVGVAAVGIGGIVSIAKPAITSLKALTTAQDAYSKAVLTYGKHSTQAKTAQAQLTAAQKAAGPVATGVAKALHSIGERWTDLTKAGRNDFFGLISDSLKKAQSLLPMFAKSANSSMSALRDGVKAFLDQVTGPGFDGFIHTMTVTFAKAMPLVSNALANVAQILMRIAVAAAPDLIRMIERFDHWSNQLLASTGNANKLQHGVHGLVSQTNSWIDLLKATGGLMLAVFGSGANQGQHLVDQLTSKLKDWTNWINHHQAAVHQFFAQALDTTRQLAGILVGFVPTLMQVTAAMRPISSVILAAVTALNSIKVGNITALTGLLGAMLVAKEVKAMIGLYEGLKAAAVAAGTAEAGAAAGGTRIGGLSMVGGEAATGIAGTLAKVLPGALAAVGIGNVLMSAVGRDAKGAAAKGGGLIAGAIAGGLVGGLPGALAGAGIGSLLGGVIAGLFHGTNKVIPIQQRLADTAATLTKRLKGEKDATHALAQSQDKIVAAHKKAHDAARQVTAAEQALERARNKYPANSHQVIEAEHKVRDAKDSDRRATKQLNDAEKLHGIELKLARQTYVSTVQAERDRIQVLKTEVQHLEHHAKAALDAGASDQTLQRIQGKLTTATGNLDKAQRDRDQTLQDASQQVGPKYAKSLIDITDRTNKVTDKTVAFAHKVMPDFKGSIFDTSRALNNPLGTSLDQTAKKTGKAGDSFDPAARNWKKRTHQMGANVIALSSTTGSGLLTIGDNANQILGSLGAKKLNFSIKKAAANANPFAQGGAFRVPGNSPGDTHTLALDDKPIARVESNEIIHVLNRTASAQAQQLQTLNDNIPRRAKGGFVFPFDKGQYQWGRTDMGVDFTGSGAIRAIGAGRVLGVGAPGWPEGGGVQYAMDQPVPGLSSRDIYVNEGVAAMVRVGQRIMAGQQIAQFRGSSIELGQATSSGAALAASHYSEGDVTAEGSAMHRVLQALEKGHLASAASIARVMLQGPPGPLRTAGQAALDLVRKAAQSYVDQKSRTSGGVMTAGPPLKGGKTVAASWFDSGDGSVRGGSGMPYGNTGFAELGWSGGPETAATGLGGLPYGAKVALGFKGHSAIGTKVDVGAGGAGIGGYPRGIDIGSGLARGLGMPVPFGLELVQVKAAQKGGFVDPWGNGLAHFANGGTLDMLRGKHHHGHVGGAAGPGGPGASGGKPGRRGGIIPGGIWKPGKGHKKRLKKFLKRIKTEGLDPDLAKKIRGAQTDVETFGDYADRADSMNTQDAVGTTLLGKFRGQTEVGWLGDEIESLRHLRNLLLKGEDQIKGTRDLLAKQLKKAKDKLKAWQKRADSIKHEQDHIARQVKDINDELAGTGKGKHHKGPSHARRKHLNDRLDKLHKKAAYLDDAGHRANYSAGVLSGKVIPALKAQDKTDQGRTRGLESSLVEVEGRVPDPLAHRHIKEFKKPYDFRFSGEIFDAMMSLKDLRGSLKPPAPDHTGDIAQLLSQKLLESQQKLLVSQSQYGVFEQFLGLPVFHSGGIYRAPMPGGEGLAVLKDREGIFKPEQMRSMAPVGDAGDVVILADFYVGGEKIDERVEVKVREVHRKAISTARRRF